MGRSFLFLEFVFWRMKEKRAAAVNKGNGLIGSIEGPLRSLLLLRVG